ncbi:MAG: Histidine triad protein [Microgenomates group bacterium GW2011_GWC1_49_7]|nr:MAG: Histidine triad protein [Microgenomates group bacterium GW2011_GWC1_49_7]
MTNCIFCKVVANQIPSYTVYEDAQTRGFLDIFPTTDGAVMVIHKRHEEKINGYTKKEIAVLFATVQKVAAGVEKAFATAILTIGINHGEPAGVHHLHVHVIPRFVGDGGGIIQSLPNRKPKETLETVKEKIKGVL